MLFSTTFPNPHNQFATPFIKSHLHPWPVASVLSQPRPQPAHDPLSISNRSKPFPSPLPPFHIQPLVKLLDNALTQEHQATRLRHPRLAGNGQLHFSTNGRQTQHRLTRSSHLDQTLRKTPIILKRHSFTHDQNAFLCRRRLNTAYFSEWNL